MTRAPSSALVTGGASGIGAAITERLRGAGAEVHVLDLANGFDVGDPAAWEDVPAVDLACLNAGVLTGTGDMTGLTDEQYRRALGANVNGVVFGVRRLARVMEPGSAIVATASLAGLVAVESEPIYALTKHAVVGFVRSVAPQLERRGIRINMVNPGFADTPMVDGETRAALDGAGFPLLRAEDVADAVLTAARSDTTGEAWIVQPGRAPVRFRWPSVPGPRDARGESVAPPPALTG